MTDDTPPSLKTNGTDRATSLAMALAGMLPVAGSLISELISNVVPNQRADRIANYVTALGQRIASLEVEARPKLEDMTPEKTALFEDGAFASARALSDERIEQIARMVVAGMSGDERDAEYQRRYLRLLQDLFDTDLVALHSIASWRGVPTSTKLMSNGDAKLASDEELRTRSDRRSIESDQQERLKRLGLVRQELQIYPPDWMKRGAVPRLQFTRAELTGLGWTLLECIGQAKRVRQEYSLQWQLTHRL